MIEIILRDYDRCPKCGSTFVEYDLQQKRYRCLVRNCDWKDEAECLPLTSTVTGRKLTADEILEMVRRKLEKLGRR